MRSLLLTALAVVSISGVALFAWQTTSASAPPSVATSARSASVSSSSLAAAAPREKAPKPPKSPKPPKPSEEPSTPPAPEEPPTPPAPEGPPVVPEPPAPPVPPAAPGAVTALACTAGDMVDVITFAPPSDGGPVSGYALYLGAAEATPTLVAEVGADARSFTVPVTETALRSYRVATTGAGGDGPLSGVVTNSLVSITREVPPQGETIRASNGEMSLALPPGSYAATTTVTVTEVDGSPRGGLISLAGVYELSPSGPLGASATLSVAYTTTIEHFQVREAVLSQAKLMTYGAASGTWSDSGSAVTADATYLTGTLSHFSYWTAATVQPHGTSTTLYCADGGLCHNLSTYPDSATRIAARSSEVCYNCHGTVAAPGASLPSPDVESEFALPGSHHPVIPGAFSGAAGSGLYCVICHDPHADPTASPGLLKAKDAATGTYVQGGGTTAPGNAFCWTCHGTVTNKLVNYYQPGYFLRTGGDKTGTTSRSAHDGSRVWSVRTDSSAELARGAMVGTAVSAGSVGISTNVTRLPYNSPYTVSPAFAATYRGGIFDGDRTTTYGYWSKEGLGASDGTVGSGSVVMDFGHSMNLSSVRIYSDNAANQRPDVVEIALSGDGSAWTTVATAGVVGTELSPVLDVVAEGQGRYLKLTFTKRFIIGYSCIWLWDMDVFASETSGTWEAELDISRDAVFQGGTVSWSASVPAGSSVALETRASLDDGATWTPWAAAVNGGPVSQIAVGSSLDDAVLMVRSTMSLGGAATSPTIDWVQAEITRAPLDTVARPWSGAGGAVCLECHTAHGSVTAGLTRSPLETCADCHNQSSGTYFAPAMSLESVHKTDGCASCHSAHGQSDGTGGTFSLQLTGDRRALCDECHPSIDAKLSATTGYYANWARHDVNSADQVVVGSRIRCEDCHSAHSPSGLVNPDDTSVPYTALRDDPASIAVSEVTLYPTKDTVIARAADKTTLNYGASPEMILTSVGAIPDNILLLDFDLSAIPSDAVIHSATLAPWVFYSTTYPTYSGGYNVAPILQPWQEGTGTGSVNDGTVNGATWLETRFGDNAWTGAVAGGDWAAQGGDFGAVGASQPYIAGYDGVTAARVRDLVNELRGGGYYGMAVVPAPGWGNTYMAVGLRENTTHSYRPRLRITYSTTPASRKTLDDVTFCLTCHDGNAPLGVRGQSLNEIAYTWENWAVHGGQVGYGPASQSVNRDKGDGGLRAPYYYGMAAIGCTTCHDPHGSANPYHIPNVVNGQPVIITTTGISEENVRGRNFTQLCKACHLYPPAHASRAEQANACTCHGVH